MHRMFARGLLAAFIFVSGCIQPQTGPVDLGNPPDPVETTSVGDGDSNGDGVVDSDQFFGTGIHPVTGEPIVIYFFNEYMPEPIEEHIMAQIGFGGCAYDESCDDDWVYAWKALAPYDVNKVQRGWALTGILENLPIQGVPVAADPDTLEVVPGGWTNAELAMKDGDDERFFVSHVNHQGCPNESTATEIAFKRVGKKIVSTGDVAPPDPDCY